MSEDLWPSDIGETDLKPPMAILREQATFLSERTGGLVQVEVKSRVINNEMIHNTFELVIPNLDGYRYELMEVRHQVSFYPLDVLPRSGHNLPNYMEVDNEKRFLSVLGSLFSAPEVRALIHSLVAQARASA
jgi:hypothetical protein